MLNHLIVHQNVTFVLPVLLDQDQAKSSRILLARMLKKFGASICSPILLGSSPTIQAYKKEAHYY
jgi:hypothetical protein